MKRLKFLSGGRAQGGFTVLELIAVLAITGLIGASVAMAIAQVSSQSTRNRDYTTANQHAMNAVYWIGRDALMAQSVNTSVSPAFLTLTWTDWNNTSSNVTYKIENGTLKRSFSANSSTPGEMLIASYINATSANTTCNFTGSVLNLRVTATVGTGRKAVSVTKESAVIPRPGL